MARIRVTAVGVGQGFDFHFDDEARARLDLPVQALGIAEAVRQQTFRILMDLQYRIAFEEGTSLVGWITLSEDEIKRIKSLARTLEEEKALVLL